MMSNHPIPQPLSFAGWFAVTERHQGGKQGQSLGGSAGAPHGGLAVDAQPLLQEEKRLFNFPCLL